MSGWLPILDGPKNGCQFLPPDDPRPGQRVNCGERNKVNGNAHEPRRSYRINETCTAVVWTIDKDYYDAD